MYIEYKVHQVWVNHKNRHVRKCRYQLHHRANTDILLMTSQHISLYDGRCKRPNSVSSHRPQWLVVWQFITMLPIHLTDVTTVTAIVRCTEGKRVNIYIFFSIRKGAFLHVSALIAILRFLALCVNFSILFWVFFSSRLVFIFYRNNEQMRNEYGA